MADATLTVRVARKQTEADGICSLELVSPSGVALPAFTAGAHIDVQLPGGLTRQYSLCNSPLEVHRYVNAVLRDPASRGGSQAVHEAVHEGDMLTISVPKNHFALASDAKRHLLLAGGIGVTPLLAMAEQLSAQGAAFDLHYCARSKSRAAFVQRMADAQFASHVHGHWDDAPEQPAFDVTALLKQPEAGVHVYVCGPKGFMDLVLSTARSAGWPEAQLHCEFFGADVVHLASDAAFTVKIASTGQEIQVPADQTVVQALQHAGVDIPIACEQGVCGTCLTRVLEGIPDHKDMYLTPEEQAANDQFLPCCSRSKSARMVLDI
jgi:vanillate O-demethylase ferredoxin subunit